MKRLVLFLGITIAASAITWALKAQTKPEEKRYNVSMTIPEWEKTISQLQWVQLQIKKSDLPARDALYATDSTLTPLMQQIFAQLNSQIQAEQKKAQQPKDSTSKQKK